MSEIKDDPREVLVLLNSLGFVGITAAQLKAFMKDLKIYRKIKEREKQQRREEIKAKIISKQQALIKEAQRCQDIEHFFDNDELVKVRIRCIPKEKDIQTLKQSKETVIKSDAKLTTTKPQQQPKEDVITDPSRIHCKQDHSSAKSYPTIRRSRNESRQNIPPKDSHLSEKSKHDTGIKGQVNPAILINEYPISEPILSDQIVKSQVKSIASDSIKNVRAQSALSAKSSVNSGHKSFIRPWRLQSEAQKHRTNKKCDPVALYQKYQQEWKQISFPGEAKHSKIRWAVREKMLGADSHSASLPRKSASMPILKKK